MTLGKLRKKYDDIHKQVFKKELELERIKKNGDSLGFQEIILEGETYKAANEFDSIDQRLDVTKTQHDEAALVQRTYEQMIDRMKKDLIALKIHNNELQTSLKSKNLIKGDEEDKQRKAKEDRLQSKHKFDELMKNIEAEQKKRQDRIVSLQNSIRNKEDAV